MPAVSLEAFTQVTIKGESPDEEWQQRASIEHITVPATSEEPKKTEREKHSKKS